MRQTWPHIVVMVLLVTWQAHAAIDGMQLAGVTETAATPSADVERVMVRCLGYAAPEGLPADAWLVVDLFSPLPDATGRDLLEVHTEWRDLRDDGYEYLWRSPCYSMPEVRAARMAQIAALLQSKPAGICLNAAPHSDWPGGVNLARAFGFNTPAVNAFVAGGGPDPRKAPAASLERAKFAVFRAEGIRALLAAVRERFPDTRLALACSEKDLLPHSAVSVPLDVPGWIGAGLLDEAMVEVAGPTNLMNLKLSTDRDLPVWVWCRGKDLVQLGGAMIVALQAAGADGVVIDFPGDTGQAVAGAREAARVRQERLAAQKALREAVERGDYVVLVAAETPVGKADQSTMHGTAQSFRLDQAATAQVVGVFASLRGEQTASLAPVQLSLRADDGDKPGKDILATVTFTADDFAREPAYQWGYAKLDKPLALEAGKVYWLYAPDTTSESGVYMWRTMGDAYPGGNAWSSRYDYKRFDWGFKILAGKE